MHLRKFSLALSGAYLAYAGPLGPHVERSAGEFEGFVDPAVPGVKQWLGIPFAEPPTGPRRFLPPIPKSSRGEKIQALKASPSCQQYLSALPSIFNNETQEFLAHPPFSEDCLYLNVIAPTRPKAHKLPVLVWFHGGMAMVGGIDTPYEKPQKWVQRTQEHIVVQINYRLNFFGFPHAKGLNENNLGILDQRLALEWVRDHIAKFGGDCENIVAWGQSAGAGTADAHQFAFPKDPIFKSMILESGTTLIARTDTDVNKTSFSFAAAHFGCPANSSPAEEVECMRKIDASKIEAFLQDRGDRNATPSLYFGPNADGKVGFLPQEYVKKGKAGDYANVPAIIGTNSEEGASFVPFSKQGPPKPVIDATTLKIIQCPVAATTRYREASGRLTYRYLYGGNFTNISPLPWIGAAHFTELPLVMGTYGDYRGPGTPFEKTVSETLQDLWLAFAKDPHQGLQGSGWEPYSANGSAIVFAKNNTLVQQEKISVLDNGCPAT